MSKIIQLAVALNSEGEESLYALTDDGRVLQRNWAMLPRKVCARDGGFSYIDGRTEGWVEVANREPTSVKHDEDSR